MEETHQISNAPEILNKAKNDVHFLIVPYPMHSHVAPMLQLSKCIATHGCNVTVVITEDGYRRTIKPGEGAQSVRLVTLPDGLDRKDMQGHVCKLIEEAKNVAGSGHEFTCLIADSIFGWGTEVAQRYGIKVAFFWTSSPGALAGTLKIPELIQSGFIDSEGTPIKKGKIQLLQEFPSMNDRELPWNSLSGSGFPAKTMFKIQSTIIHDVVKDATWLLCNWFNDLCPSASTVIPNIVPIGPLRTNRHLSDAADLSYLIWLDQQPPKSVVYVAFGTISTLTQFQLEELASGLEHCGRRFLWVVRAGLIRDGVGKLPDGFTERVEGFSKVVEWTNQEKVLAHPSVGCFLMHCGWNSTMEGLCNGVPLLCWPCFADQPFTRSCICDAWKVGLSLVREENSEIISAVEIQTKIDELLSRGDLIDNALKVKEIAKNCVAEGGSSFETIRGFIEQVRSRSLP